MQKWKKAIITIIVSLAIVQVHAQTDNYDSRVADYIATYKDLAIREQQRTGIPAAITLAQGIHETSAGTSELATEANNHFGIKCKKEWTGETFAHTDDAPNECFRKYRNANDSYTDHSDYLKNAARYNSLFRLSVTDYAAWALGLKRCGYATNPRYAQVLIKLIETYHLQDYTYAAMNDNVNPLEKQETPAPVLVQTQTPPVTEAAAPAAQPAPGATNKKSRIVISSDDDITPPREIKNEEKPDYGQLVRVNGLKAFYAKKGSSLLNDAVKHNLRYARLLEINDLPDAPLDADMFIYLEKKHTKGNSAFHVLKPGETLLQAAQYEGMQMKYLKYYNKLEGNEQPVAGSLLYLQEMADQKPEVEKEVLLASAMPKETFAGDRPKPIPQGATRMRAGYISKTDIESAATDHSIEQAKPVIKKTEEPAAEDAPQTTIATQALTSEDSEEKAATMGMEPVPAPVEHNDIANLKTQEAALAVPVTPVTPPLVPEAEEVAAMSIQAKEEQPLTAPEQTIVSDKEEDKPTAGIVKADEPARKEAETAEQVSTDKMELASIPVATDPDPAIGKVDPVQDAATNNNTIEKIAVEPAAMQPVKEEPKDEFDRLKEKLDKVVYASDTHVATATQPEVKAQPKPVPGTAKSASGFVGLYTVKKGDTAFSIAKKHHISMKQLMEWNELDFKEIKVGQQLRVK